MVEQKGIYLVSVQFTDNSGFKKRPVVVVSCDDFNNRQQDFLACPITKNPDGVGVPVDNSSLEHGHLEFPSRVKSSLPSAFCKTRIVKQLGVLKPEVARQIISDIHETIAMPSATEPTESS